MAEKSIKQFLVFNFFFDIKRIFLTTESDFQTKDDDNNPCVLYYL